MRFCGVDPSTKTGIVILDRDGNVHEAREIAPKGVDPVRMMDIIDQTAEGLERGDMVVIEGFGFNSQSGFLLGGIGWGIRMRLYESLIEYHEVAPNQLKKFAGGKGNAKKDELSVDIFKRWGFEHKSDNVRDAYVLAQIARALVLPLELPAYQGEIIEAIKRPKPKKKRGGANGK